MTLVVRIKFILALLINTLLVDFLYTFLCVWLAYFYFLVPNIISEQKPSSSVLIRYYANKYMNQTLTLCSIRQIAKNRFWWWKIESFYGFLQVL